MIDLYDPFVYQVAYLVWAYYTNLFLVRSLYTEKHDAWEKEVECPFIIAALFFYALSPLTAPILLVAEFIRKKP